MSLEGTAWIVTHIGGEPVIKGSEPTIAFEGGRAAGTTGCNRWFSAYRVEEGTVSFGPAGSTMMMCADPGVMEQEQAFLSSLEMVRAYAIDGGFIALSGSEGTDLLRVAPASK